MTLPSEFYLVNGEESCTFLYVKHVDANPSVVASVICLQDLSVRIHVGGKVCSNSRFAHLLTHDGKVQSVVDVVNLLACVKSLLLNDDTQDSVEQFEYLKIAADMIDPALLSTNYEDNRQLLSFLAAQLRLCATPAKGRRYPIDLIILSFSWKITGTALYKKCQKFYSSFC